GGMATPLAAASPLLQLLHYLSSEQPPGPTAILREVDALERVLEHWGNEESDYVKISAKLLPVILSNRLCNELWVVSRPGARWTNGLLRMTKGVLKEKNLADHFHQLHRHNVFKKFIDTITKQFLANPSDQLHAENTTLALNVIHRLLGSVKHASFFVDARTHRALLPLLQCREMNILQATLEVLGRLSDWVESCRLDLCQSTAIDVCLQMAPESDLLTQKLCVSLLRVLACEINAREQIKIYDGIPLLVSLLSVRNSRLQWHVAWTLAQLADDAECSLEIGQRGAIAVILSEMSLLQPPQRAVSDWISMLTGLCALLAQLCQNDSNEVLIIRNNGLYIVGQNMLLPLKHVQIYENQQFEPFLCSCFRVLRLLFSMERNRHFFKKVFEPDMFGKFIDVGHYVQDLSEYQELARDFIRLMKNEETEKIITAWDTLNQEKTPLGEVGEYELLQQLGAGAFGCVYTVRKKASPMQFYALKEIYMMESRQISPDKSFGDIISEVKIIKQQLRHPNIVRYRRIFVENQRLYIVMDLIDGASLKDHIHSTAEKRTRFVETRIWNIVVQLILALRYLHKDKRIVHRDLKPNNIMLGENDRVVITDFGLAKQRMGADYLKSAAGTIVYSCPEIVQNMPYGEKADIWSLGCCIYELCNLKPAFYSQNMLKLTMLIVEGTYEPVMETYSERLRELVSACLDANDKNRPDIIQVGEYMVERLMMALDEQIRASYKRAKDDMTASIPSSSSLLSFTASTPTDKNISRGTSFTRSDSLNSSANSEVLSASMREVREKEKKEGKRVKLPVINNSIDKAAPEKRKGRGIGNKLKSFSAGSRTSLSNSLPRIGGLSGSTMNVNRSDQ
ncbi:hypothetical protein PMAYCL1PPCAC_14523, partial [Pristionchus mayeri]